MLARATTKYQPCQEVRGHQRRTEKPWTLDLQRWPLGQVQGHPWRAGKSSEQTHQSSLWQTSAPPVGLTAKGQIRISFRTLTFSLLQQIPRANVCVLSNQKIINLNNLLQFPLWQIPSASFWSYTTIHSNQKIMFCIWFWHLYLCHPLCGHKTIRWKIILLYRPICPEQSASVSLSLWCFSKSGLKTHLFQICF